MSGFQLSFGIISVLIGVSAYYFYIRDILSGHTKPHAFSWLIWGLLAANGFIAQTRDHAGYGAWAILLTSSANLLIFLLAIAKGDSRPTIVDWVLLGFALAGLASLFIVHDQALGVWITIIALYIGFALTIIKGIKKPNEETSVAFLLNAIKYVPATLALQHFSFDTAAYPIVAFFGNALIMTIIIVSRKRLGTRAPVPPS